MASFFGHAVLGFAIAKLSTSASSPDAKKQFLKTSLLCMACAAIPDLDFIGYKMGVEYDSTFGHRGFSHSILFALLLSFLFRVIFYSKEHFNSPKAWKLVLLFFVCTISHGLLDSLTTGGLGVAYFSPFSNERYFFPWHPIKVSSLNVAKFFGAHGWKVIKSEAIWIGIPSLLIIIVRVVMDKARRKRENLLN